MQLQAVILAVLIYRYALFYGAKLSICYLHIFCASYFNPITPSHFGFTECAENI